MLSPSISIVQDGHPCWKIGLWIWFVSYNKLIVRIPNLFDCKPRLTEFSFHHFVRLTMKGGLQSRAAYIFFCSLSKGLDQWFLTFFTYLTLLSNTITRFTPNTFSGALFLKIRN